METRLLMTEVMFGDHSILTMENGNYKYDIKTGMSGTSVVVQWLRFLISTAGGEGLIPDPELRFHMPLSTPTTSREKKKDCGSLCYYFYYVAKLFLYQYPQICR